MHIKQFFLEGETPTLRNETLPCWKWHNRNQYGINTCIYTIIYIKTSHKSKTRVHYCTFDNNDFVALPETEFFIIFLWKTNLFGTQIDHFNWSKGFWTLAVSCAQLQIVKFGKWINNFNWCGAKAWGYSRESWMGVAVEDMEFPGILKK